LKIRYSGMPKEEKWAQFFNPSQALNLLGVNHNIANVVDFGCGYGTFTIPAATIISGKIYAFDIEPEMINMVKQKANALHLGNVEAILRDFISEGSGLKGECIDFVFLFNVLHGEKPERLLEESFRILKLGGKVGIIMMPQHLEGHQWISDPDLNNVDVGLNPQGLFLKENSTLNPTTMVLF
jgi:ubiquinone/menaquinone biosynthesis C-methylase UbiE